MTLLADAPPEALAAPLRPPLVLGERWPTVPLALGATALTLAMTGFSLNLVLRGGFSDPDDAMRLVEVRAWLGGQGWFDIAAHRLDPPLGASMHWSRLVDLPTAALIRLFSIVAPRASAERWACIAVPSLFLVALYLAVARLATVLAGPRARAMAVLGLLLSGAALISFVPGRIGHHAPETLVLVLAVGAALASLDRGRETQAAVAGALAALGLAMSLEALPFLAALCAAMVAFWIVRGSAFARALTFFGTVLGATLITLFSVSVPPQRWLAPTCDAMGAAHLGAGLIGAVGAIALARGSARLPSPGRRATAAAAVGALILLFLALAYPACLRSPFAGVDPLVRAIWLDNVVESKPLLAFARTRPMAALALAGPIGLGLVGSLFAALTMRGAPALRYATIAGLTALGLALSFWQVRVFASVAPLALCGGLPLLLAWRDRLAARGLSRLAAFAPLFILPFTTTVWALALPEDAAPAAGSKAATKTACLAPEALAPLAALGQGRAVAPIDLGSHLLVATSLDVFAAPYHRNDDGNRFMIDVFLAAPAQAERLLASRGATYVVTCGGETARLAVRAPDGLAARLAAGMVPDFLRRVPVPGTPYDVFAVRPQGRG